MSAEPTSPPVPATTIVELRGPGGQLLERLRTDLQVLQVGRAFDNDVIVDDIFVSPHHLRLERDGGSWTYRDLDTLNGVRRKGRPSREGVLKAGESLTLGRTTLWLYDEHQPAEPAQRFDPAEISLASLGRLPVVACVAAIGMAKTSLESYLGSYEEVGVSEVLVSLLAPLLVCSTIAAAWALVGRLLRHRALFFAHFSLWMILDLAASFTSFFSMWVGYNAGSRVVQNTLDYGLGTIVSACAIWGSLCLATHLGRRPRIYAAAGTSGVLIAIVLAFSLDFESEFSPYPEYYGVIRHPALLWVAPEPEARLVESLPALFDRADAVAEEEEDEGDA